MDGVQTAKKIRTEINNDYAKNIPIIALTADALVGNEEKFIAKGFDAFISKPIDTVRLDEILNKYVRKPDLDPVDVCESEIESIEYEIPDIDGVDYVSALSRFGSEAVYLDIIKSFVKNTPSILDRVKTITKESLAEYAIDVHGIKGASRAIGAVELGFKAEELEHAAKKNLFGFCIAGNIGFLKIAQKLIDDLSAFLETRKTTEVDKPKKDKPDKDLLDRLKTAVENYDMNEIDAVMAELEKYSYEDNILEEIKSYLEMSDFSEIIELLEK
jgi:CheY-like chemotaxis protein